MSTPSALLLSACSLCDLVALDLEFPACRLFLLNLSETRNKIVLSIYLKLYFSNTWFIVTSIQKSPVDDLDSSSVADQQLLVFVYRRNNWCLSYQLQSMRQTSRGRHRA